MEDVLFSIGSTERIVCTLRYFKERPVIRELTAARGMLTIENPARYFPKNERLQAVIFDRLKNFLGMFQCRRGDGNQGGGRR